MFCRRFGNKSILKGAWQIKKTFVAAVWLRRAAMARHHIGIDIDRIDRVRDCDFVLVAKNIEDIPAIGFRSVRDKNLIVGDLDVAVAIILLGDYRPQKFVALLGTVAAKGFTFSEFIYRLLHRVDCRGWERLRDIADSAANQTFARFRIRLAKLVDTARNFRKQITSLKLEIIFV